MSELIVIASEEMKSTHLHPATFTAEYAIPHCLLDFPVSEDPLQELERAPK